MRFVLLWKGFRRVKVGEPEPSARAPSPLGRARPPALLPPFTPQLNSFFTAQLPAVLPLRGRLRLEQGDRFAWQQFAADDLQSLAVVIPANWSKPQHQAAITEPPGA